MNPVGIGLAFMLFWALVGLGLFLTFAGFLGLGQAPAAHGITARHSASGAFGQFGYAVMLLVGLVMLASGGYAIYAVVYR